MATFVRRMASFFGVVKDRMGEETSDTLKGIWDEVCIYVKCTELVKKGKRQGQECGKACPYAQTKCMCHLPRALYAPADRKRCSFAEEDTTCTRVCKKNETMCPMHLHPCKFVLSKGKNAGKACGKKADESDYCKKHKSMQGDEEEEKPAKKAKKSKKSKKHHDKPVLESDVEEENEDEEEDEEEPRVKLEEAETEDEEEEEEEPRVAVAKPDSDSDLDSYAGSPQDNPFDTYPESEEEEEEPHPAPKPVVATKPAVSKPVVAKSPVAKSPVAKCTFVLRSGVNKGMPCNKKCMEGKEMCVIHKKK